MHLLANFMKISSLSIYTWVLLSKHVQSDRRKTLRLLHKIFYIVWCPKPISGLLHTVTGRSVYRQGLVGFLSYYALSPSHRSPVVYLSAERMQHFPAKQLSCQAGGGHGSSLALILINELLLRCLYLNSHSLRSARLSLFVLNKGKKCSLGFLTIKRRGATAALIKNVLGSSCYTYCIFSEQYKL